MFLNPVDTVNGKDVLNSALYVMEYRSAPKWFYESQGTELPADVMKQLGWYTLGFKLVKKQRKQDGEEEAEEGKQPMQFAG